MGFLNKLNNEGKTIIIVTHNPELAKEHAKTIYSVKDGHIENIEKRSRVNGKALFQKELIYVRFISHCLDEKIWKSK